MICAFCSFSLIKLLSLLLFSWWVIFCKTLFVVVLLSKLNFTWFILFVVFPFIKEFSFYNKLYTSNWHFKNICYFFGNWYFIRNKFLNTKWFKRCELLNILNIFFTIIYKILLPLRFDSIYFYCWIYQNLSVVSQYWVSIRTFARIIYIVFKFVCM